MSEKRFILCQDDLGNYEIRYDGKVFHFLWEVAPILNKQQERINELCAALKIKKAISTQRSISNLIYKNE